MRRLLFIFLLAICSHSAFAQFPLGSNATQIKAYFDTNIAYLNEQDFKTENGTPAMCFRKVKEVGDYVFYFDSNGNCFTYTVTYDKNELPDLVSRFDNRFVKIYSTKWTAQDNSFDVTLVPPKPGENYFSIVYRPLDASNSTTNILASN